MCVHVIDLYKVIRNRTQNVLDVSSCLGLISSAHLVQKKDRRTEENTIKREEMTEERTKGERTEDN